MKFKGRERGCLKKGAAGAPGGFLQSTDESQKLKKYTEFAFSDRWFWGGFSNQGGIFWICRVRLRGGRGGALRKGRRAPPVDFCNLPMKAKNSKKYTEFAFSERWFWGGFSNQGGIFWICRVRPRGPRGAPAQPRGVLRGRTWLSVLGPFGRRLCARQGGRPGNLGAS